MSVAARLSYPSKAQITRVLQAAKAFGIDVAGFEVSPDGTIRLIPAQAIEGPTASLRPGLVL